MNSKAFGLGILLVYLTSPSFGQTFSAPILVSSRSGSHSPEMHIGRDGAINVSWFQANADIYFSRSEDAGKTFSTPTLVSRQVTTNNYTSLLQRAPEFVIDTKGTIHLVWMEARIKNPITKQEQSDIWYVRSTNNGVSWSQPLSIMDPDDSTLYAQDFPAIACDSSDNLYVSYLDNRYLMRKAVDRYKMHLQHSTDGGASWSLPVVADKLPMTLSGTCECCRQDIAVSPTGTVYIAFRTNMDTKTGDKRDIFICRSHDRGLTFDSTIRAQLGGWTLSACPTKGPHIALDPQENLHLSWNDARDDSGKLIAYYTMLRAGESSINANYSISNSNAQAGNWPDVTCGGGGLLACAFMPQLNGQPIQLSYSSDGGNTWKRPVSFPGAASDDQELPIVRFAPNGSLYSLWQDGDKDKILFSTISGMNPVQLPGKVTSLIAKSYLPNRRIVLQWTKPQLLGSAQFVRYSLTINSNPAVNLLDTAYALDSLPAGTYDYEVKAKSIIGESSVAGTFAVASASVRSMDEQLPTTYPNPVHGGVISVRIPELRGTSARCQIINSAGKICWVGDLSISDHEIRIPITGLAKGAYQIQVANLGSSWQTQTVVE